MSGPRPTRAAGSLPPVLFVGHGSPMNAIQDNAWSRGFRALGGDLEGQRRPAAILAVSAHWFVPGTYLTASANPPTIHDFGGFPPELYEVEYPAAGDAELAQRVAHLLARFGAEARDDWGLDHGTWSVLRHLRPAADVPVVQLSIDARRPAAEHLAIGRALEPLRAEGVLILASGNAVHDLADAFARLRSGDTTTPPWAERFDAALAVALERRDADFLVRALDTDEGARAHPTPEHYLPVLYAAGAGASCARVSFPVTGFDLGSLSMRCAVFS